MPSGCSYKVLLHPISSRLATHSHKRVGHGRDLIMHAAFQFLFFLSLVVVLLPPFPPKSKTDPEYAFSPGCLQMSALMCPPSSARVSERLLPLPSWHRAHTIPVPCVSTDCSYSQICPLHLAQRRSSTNTF